MDEMEIVEVDYKRPRKDDTPSPWFWPCWVCRPSRQSWVGSNIISTYEVNKICWRCGGKGTIQFGKSQ